ncbi:MAG: hypothetical protein ACOCYC_04780 [bacterium]
MIADSSAAAKESERLAARIDRGTDQLANFGPRAVIPSHPYDFAPMVTKLCFPDDPEQAVDEMLGVIKREGCMVLGFVDRESAAGPSILPSPIDAPRTSGGRIQSQGHSGKECGHQRRDGK